MVAVTAAQHTFSFEAMPPVTSCAAVSVSGFTFICEEVVMSCHVQQHHITEKCLEQCRFHTLDRYPLTDASITLTIMCGINAAPGKWGALSNTPATSVRKMTRKSSYAPRSVWKQVLSQEMIASPLKIEQFCEESNTTSPCKTGTNPTSSMSRIA